MPDDEHDHPTHNYWELTKDFLGKYAVNPDGSRVSPNIINALMVGVWVGARFSAMDGNAAATLSAIGNGFEDDKRFKSLRDGFDQEFAVGVGELVRRILINNGFSHMRIEQLKIAPSPLTDVDKQAAVDEVEKLYGKED